MFTFLKNLFSKKIEFTGALLDKRKDKSNDVLFSEIVAKTNVIQWHEKPKTFWREFPVLNQYQTYSCVAHSLAKCLGIYYKEKFGYYVNFSPAYIYVNRMNKLDDGMFAYDAWRILKEKGTTLFETLPTPKTETEINKIEIKKHLDEVAKVFRISTEINLNNLDIDIIASIIETTKKGVSVWFYFDSNEWAREIPVILNNYTLNNAPLRHAVVAVDYTLFNGQKALIIEDSAHFGGINKRVITENFFKKRCFYAGYFMNFKFEESDKPKYVFNKDLSFGTKDKDVEILQACLRFEGLYPSNISITGYFGKITLDSVKKFQKKYGINDTGIVDSNTRNILNQLFG
ncbi:MAG: peptidoglycan-binding protein [Patescibacteria group bacterium]|nr:peptidoglycan-binding protein [Patescibacteria group bacterium]